ncbi:hypothetical protein Tco_1095981 [Tanacetum coccineum]
MERGFLSSLGRGGGRGVEEKLSGATHISVKAMTSTSKVVPKKPTFVPSSAPENSSGGSPEVVKDGMESGCVDPKVVEGVNEPVRTIPKSFATSKVNFRSLDSDKPINAKAEVKIPKASFLDVYSRFGFSLADQELKEDMVIAIPNVEDDGEVDNLVNEDINSEVKEVYDETSLIIVFYEFSMKVMVKTEDPCDDDDFDDPSLTDAQMKFANAFDINLRGQLR